MSNERKEGAETGSRMASIGAGLLAALVSFAAVYVTLRQPDNGASAATEAPPKPAAAATGAETAFAGFVRRDAELPLAEIKFSDGAGTERSLADFKGKVVLLNLWATWCAPCRKEMPSLDRLQKELGSETFEVVALSLDRAGLDAARKFFDEIKVQSLSLYIDPTMKAGNALRAVGMPTSILIGRDGREIGRLPGPAEWDTPAAKQLIADASR